jgi:hypothetical protein
MVPNLLFGQSLKWLDRMGLNLDQEGSRQLGRPPPQSESFPLKCRAKEPCSVTAERVSKRASWKVVLNGITGVGVVYSYR